MSAPLSRSADGAPDRTQEGPPLLVVTVSFAAITVVAAVLGAGSPRLTATPAEVLAYDTSNGTLMRLAATLMFGSAIPLVISAVTLQQRLRRLGVVAPGPQMGVAGGVLAAASLAASALFTWTAAQTSGLADANLAAALRTLALATGGPGFVAAFGLLVAGIAVPALVLRMVPRALAWAGLVVGVLALLSTFVLFSDALDLLLPVGRFGGALFLVAVAALLPHTRPCRTGARN